MKFFKEITLRNGQACLLRSPRADDAGEILRHMALTSGETDNMLRYPDEFVMTEEDEGKFLSRTENDPLSLMISAFIDGRLVANGGVSPVLTQEKCRHRAEFGISVQRAYWGLGIGSRILGELIAEARHAGFTRLELDVVRGNERAISMYESFGFKVYGVNEYAFRLRTGETQALILMSRGL